MSLAARCIAAIATGVVAADLPAKARAHVERRASAKRRPVKPMKRDRIANEAVAATAKRDEAGAIYAAAKVRAGHLCELCRCPGFGWDGLVCHHVVSGTGNRKQEERLENVIVIHDIACHRLIHRDPMAVAEKIRAWCDRYGYAATWQRFEKRLAKVSEARAAQRGTKP